MFEAMLLAPLLRPLTAGAGMLGDYELEEFAGAIAQRDRSGFAEFDRLPIGGGALNGDERDARVAELLPMVRRVARRLKRLVPSFDMDDLIGDGSLGLLRAVDSFDPQRGPLLEDYARRLIVGAMLNGIRRMDRSRNARGESFETARGGDIRLPPNSARSLA